MINYNIMCLGYLITLLLGIPQSYGNSTMVMMMLIMTMMVIHKKEQCSIGRKSGTNHGRDDN